MEPMQLAWLAYLLGSILLIALGWWMTWAWPSVLARLLRAWVMILLLVPAYADPDQSYLAPAWAVTFFIAAGEGIEAAYSAWWPLFCALVLATAVITVGAFVQWVRGRGRQVAAAEG